MTCTHCVTANDDGARFCEECGAPLAEACPACGVAIKPGARFCRSCGTALNATAATGGVLPSPVGSATGAASAGSVARTPTASAERRLVTVLFADLVGSTALADG